MVLLLIVLFSFFFVTSAQNTYGPKYVSFEMEKRFYPPSEAPRMVKRGNLFDQPLTNRLYYYTIKFFLGTPPQPFNLQIDTGSSDIWVSSITNPYCKEVISNSTIKQSLKISCAEQGFFDSGKSLTYRSKVDNMVLRYGDNSYAAGEFGSDILRIDNSAMKIIDMEFIKAYEANTLGVFGIGMPGLEVSAHKTDNPFEYKNFPIRLKEAGLIDSIAYSMWLNTPTSTSGLVVFGGVDIKKFIGPLIMIDLVPTVRDKILEFTVPASYINYYETACTPPLVLSDEPLVVLADVGSTSSYLPISVVNGIAAKLNMTTDAEGDFVRSCKHVGDDDKYITIQLATFELKIPVTHLILPKVTLDNVPVLLENGDPSCYLGVYASENAKFCSLGDNVLRSAYLVFDIQNKRLGVAQTKTGGIGSQILAIRPGLDGVPSSIHSNDAPVLVGHCKNSTFGNYSKTSSPLQYGSVPSGNFSAQNFSAAASSFGTTHSYTKTVGVSSISELKSQAISAVSTSFLPERTPAVSLGSNVTSNLRSDTKSYTSGSLITSVWNHRLDTSFPTLSTASSPQEGTSLEISSVVSHSSTQKSTPSIVTSVLISRTGSSTDHSFISPSAISATSKSFAATSTSTSSNLTPIILVPSQGTSIASLQDSTGSLRESFSRAAISTPLVSKPTDASAEKTLGSSLFTWQEISSNLNLVSTEKTSQSLEFSHTGTSNILTSRSLVVSSTYSELSAAHRSSDSAPVSTTSQLSTSNLRVPILSIETNHQTSLSSKLSNGQGNGVQYFSYPGNDPSPASLSEASVSPAAPLSVGDAPSSEWYKDVVMKTSPLAPQDDVIAQTGQTSLGPEFGILQAQSSSLGASYYSAPSLGDSVEESKADTRGFTLDGSALLESAVPFSTIKVPVGSQAAATVLSTDAGSAETAAGARPGTESASLSNGQQLKGSQESVESPAQYDPLHTSTPPDPLLSYVISMPDKQTYPQASTQSGSSISSSSFQYSYKADSEGTGKSLGIAQPAITTASDQQVTNLAPGGSSPADEVLSTTRHPVKQANQAASMTISISRLLILALFVITF